MEDFIKLSNIRLLAIIQLFVTYYFFGIIIRFFLNFLPKSFYLTLDKNIRGLRMKFTRLIENIFGGMHNFEVLILSRIFGPFILFIVIQSFIIALSIMVQGSLVLLVYLIMGLIFANIIPDENDLSVIMESNPNSFFIFIIKILLLTYFYTYLDPIFIFWIFLFPFSFLFIKSDITLVNQGNLELDQGDSYPAK